MADLRKEIIELIEARGCVGTADFERLRMAHSASPIEIAGEIDRVLESDARLAAKHRLAEEVTKRARAREAASLSWLDDYRDRAVALGWSRDDLAMLLSAETPGRHPSRDTTGAEPESQGVSSSNRDVGNAPPLSSRQQSDNPGEPRQGGEDDDGPSRLPEAPGHRADDDEFQIRKLIAGVAITVLLCVIVAVVIFGNEPPRVNPAEQAAWQRAEQSGSAQGYQTFIAQWPNSSRLQLARDRLASLAERQAAARDQAAHDQRTRVRQAQRYLAILGYPVDVSGEMDEETRQAIAAFEQRRDLPRRGVVDPGFLRSLEAAWRAAEDDVWRQAQAADTIEAATRYLRAYPDGRHTTAARERIVQLQDAAERRELIEAIQHELVRLGRDIDINGTLDAATAQELRDYRISKGHPEDAPVDRSLLQKLRDLSRWPPQPGDTFVDCPRCPPMVMIPGGQFVMGSPPDELLRVANEGPQHRVTVPRFALARTEVTFDQYRHCVEAGACSYLPRDEGWGQGDRPVINVSVENAGDYVRWLSDVTGRRYRLPSEAEWEYAARSGTTTRFYTGDCLNPQQANFDARRPVGECPEGDRMDKTLPVASFSPNPFGLFDMHGNVREWTLDCWNPDYEGAPVDGSAWIGGDCSRAVLRGGSWRNAGGKLRSASRTRPSGTFHNDHTGFRPAVSVGSSE